VKYLAEDWAPVGIPLPDILTRPPPMQLEAKDLDDHGRLQSKEIDRLRGRNRRLEEEIRILQDNLMLKKKGKMHKQELQERLQDEI
jgi:hypothetical protein